MKFSVVVPSYNHAVFLQECLDSILDQQGDGISVELILMDGGSTDGTGEIIDFYKERLSHWVSQRDDGQTAAIVSGFEQSSGEIMCWLNSDDVFLPGALRRVAEAFHADAQVDLVYGDALWIARDGKPLKAQKEIDFDLDILLWVYNYIPQPSTFWRRSLWERSEKLDPDMICAMDFDLWAKFLRADASFRHIPYALSAMRRYSEQKNLRLRQQSNLEDARIREQFLGRRVRWGEARLRGLWHRARRIVKRLGAGAYFSAKIKEQL